MFHFEVDACELAEDSLGATWPTVSLLKGLAGIRLGAGHIGWGLPGDGVVGA